MEASVAPIGPLVEDGKTARSAVEQIEGEHVLLQHLESRHAESLWNNVKADERLWLYMPPEPFSTLEDFQTYIDSMSQNKDPYMYAIIDGRDHSDVLGYIALMNFAPSSRSNEVGHVLLSRKLQRSTAATEVYFLLLKSSFEHLNSRRVEWKTNTLNEGSRRAALRLGFTYEGIFRNHFIVKGRSRDTIWFSIIESEWSARKAALQAWLLPSNFDESGNQIRSLGEITASQSSQPSV